MRFKPPKCKRLQGAADVLLYFKCPTTKQMRCPVNAYHVLITSLKKITESGDSQCLPNLLPPCISGRKTYLNKLRKAEVHGRPASRRWWPKKSQTEACLVSIRCDNHFFSEQASYDKESTLLIYPFMKSSRIKIKILTRPEGGGCIVIRRRPITQSKILIVKPKVS